MNIPSFGLGTFRIKDQLLRNRGITPIALCLQITR